MLLALSSKEESEVLSYIRRIFSDFFHFDTLLSTSVAKLIHDATINEINKAFIKKLDDYLPKLETADEDSIKEMKIILMTTVIYLFSKTASAQQHLYQLVEELLSHYPEFSELSLSENPADKQELGYLLQFRNFMKLGLILLENRTKTKILLLRCCERLEGNGSNDYKTGTGQRQAVTRRADVIFHRESGHKKGKRTDTQSWRKRTRETVEEEEEIEVEDTAHQFKQKKAEPRAAKPPAYSDKRARFSMAGTALSSSPAAGISVSHSQKDHCQFLPVNQKPASQDLLDTDTHCALLNEMYSGSFTAEVQQKIRF